jgi:hypothetical protein
MTSNDEDDEDVVKKVKLPKSTIYFSDIDQKHIPKILECKQLFLNKDCFNSLTDSMYDKETCSKLKGFLDKDAELNLTVTTSEKDKTNIHEEHGVWQVVIGKHFVASLTFDAKHFLYFKFDDLKKYFLLFRS